FPRPRRSPRANPTLTPNPPYTGPRAAAPGDTMNPVDRTILAFCGEDFCAVTSLKPQIPSGTLYRHVTHLVRLGWLEKSGSLYRTTAAGHRQLQRPSGAQPWEALEEIYPPLGSVPTAVHRALIELIFAAGVARQHAIPPDR